MTSLELFRKATGKMICDRITCDHCNRIYGYKGCPQDEECTKEEVEQFVQRICKMISDRQKEETFDWEMTEDELVTIIMNYK